MSIMRPDQEDIDASHEGARFSYFQLNEGAHLTPEELRYIGLDIQDISRDAEAHVHLVYASKEEDETYFAHAGFSPKDSMPDLAFRLLDHGTHRMILTTIGVNRAVHERIKELFLGSQCNKPQRLQEAA